MKLTRDPSGALELILWDMPSGEIERVATTILREAGSVAKTYIGGNAIGCAIGDEATLTARDLIAELEDTPAAPNPAIRELLARLYKLPSFDANLPYVPEGKNTERMT